LKRIVILATAHEFQQAGHPLNHDLSMRVEYLRRAFKVQIVMEEWTEKRPSFLKGKNVGTPGTKEFNTYRCPPLNHPAHDGTLPPDQDAPSMTEYGPFRGQENRENRMVDNICSAMEDYESGLFVVGIAHLHSFFGKLRTRGFEVVGYSWLE
jgi:hypothetical protein